MNEYVETLKSLYENKDKLALKEKANIEAIASKRSEFIDKYYKIVGRRNLSEREHQCLLKECRNDMLGAALKAIYITALDEQSYLTEDQLELAESMVDRYIKENDATTIMARCKNKTYLLSELCRVVEDAAEEEAKNIENIGKEDDDEKKDDKSDEVNDAVKTAAEELVKKLEDLGYEVKKKDDAAEPAEEVEADVEVKADDAGDVDEVEVSAEEEPETDDNKEEDDDNLDIEVDDSDIDSDDGTNEAEEDIDAETDDDTLDDALDDEEDEEPKKKSTSKKKKKDDVEDEPKLPSVNKDPKESLFDELDKSDDVHDAIEVIRSRVADAEQDLIKKNAEDKKKVNDLLNKIADNVKTIEDITGKKKKDDSTDDTAIDVEETKEEKIAKESMMMYKRKINEVSSKRPNTVLEKMTRIVMSDVVKKDSLKNKYLAEDGSLDTENLVDSVKIMYGFLETVNTLQLEKVDADYIKKVLLSMNEK